MNVLAGVILGMFITILAFVVIGLTIGFFSQSFDSGRPHAGSYAIAGSILLGSSMIALAIATRRGMDS